MTHFLDQDPYARVVVSRRRYYRQLYLKRLVMKHRQMQPLPDEIEVELEGTDVE